jgi:tetratricopeptide (TPR) repeat protein
MTASISRAGRIRELFDEVADLEHAAQVAHLERSEPNADVRREVLELLGFDEKPLAMLDATPEVLAEAAGAAAPDLSTYVGRRIGPFLIEQVLGQGGMGSVFLARREDVGLTVALKLVRGALGDPVRVARFRQEASVLARLNHPYIAQLIDVGVAEDGTPYLAMEYVRGNPITTWCVEQRLDVPGRLRLFAELCDAVAFAHQQLIVHRDLKPLNVLVSPEGVVKLLDFGVAKLLDEDEDAVHTTANTRLLSPEYASPEQVMGTPVTTATDVHGLGILLFELLTGARPFTAASGRATDLFAAILRQEPRRPSLLMNAARASAGDLDAICLKALAKAPRDRYATVADLAADVRRHLDGMPVEARLPTLRYRAGKFVRRNRLGVGLGVLAAALLASAGGVFAWRVKETTDALTRAQELSAYLLDVFTSTDPAETRGIDAPLKSYLDLAVVYMDRLEGRPEEQAQLLTILSQAHVGLGDYARADSLAGQALDILRQLPGNDARVAASMVAQGNARFERGFQRDGSALLEAALPIQRRVLGDSAHATTETMLRLAEMLASQGRMAPADDFAREALALRLVNARRRDEAVADATVRLARVLALRGSREVEAERLLRVGLEIRASLYSPTDYRMDRSLTPLSQFLSERGRGAEAEEMARQALALRRQVYGEAHPRTITALNNVAFTLVSQRRIAEARSMYRQVVAHYERNLGGDHAMLAVAIKNVAWTFAMEGRVDSAATQLGRAIDMRTRLEGTNDPDVALLWWELGELQWAARQLAPAERSLQTAFDRMRLVFGESNPNTMRTGALLGAVLVNRGRIDDGERLLRPILAQQTSLLGDHHNDVFRSMSFVASALSARGKWDEALAMHQAALLKAREHVGYDDQIRRDVIAGLVQHYRAHGQPDMAERVQREEQGVARPARLPR